MVEEVVEVVEVPARRGGVYLSCLSYELGGRAGAGMAAGACNA